MDNIVQFVEKEWSWGAEAKHSASCQYEDYNYLILVLRRKRELIEWYAKNC